MSIRGLGGREGALDARGAGEAKSEALWPTFSVFFVERRRLQAADVEQENVVRLQSWGLGFGVLCFRVWGRGSRGCVALGGFGVWGVGDFGGERRGGRGEGVFDIF